eukprot:3075628-Prymnesium_polylepis.1
MNRHVPEVRKSTTHPPTSDPPECGKTCTHPTTLRRSAKLGWPRGKNPPNPGGQVGRRGKCLRRKANG